MREYCEADVRRVTLDARETDARPDLCDLVRVEGGGARGGEGVSVLHMSVPLSPLGTPLHCPY